MSIDRRSWPRLLSTIARYWCAGIAFEGRQIDIMVWCGPLRAGLPRPKSDWLTLGQSKHLHQLSLVLLRTFDWQTHQSCERSSQNQPPKKEWTLTTLKVDFYCKYINTIDFVLLQLGTKSATVFWHYAEVKPNQIQELLSWVIDRLCSRLCAVDSDLWGSLCKVSFSISSVTPWTWLDLRSLNDSDSKVEYK